MKSILFGLFVLSIISCQKPNPQVVLEITTFRLKTPVNQHSFNSLDSTIETIFTSKQPGFIKRQSAVDKNGTYTIIVYWESMQDAKASMNKFMQDSQ